jgi:ParB family chromosome partitioning protein
MATQPVLLERVPSVGVRFHEFADLFPWIEGAAFEELKADIAKNGVLEPIVFIGDTILDGRNRYMAARDLGMEYPRIEYHGSNPLAFVIAKNLARRHLSESQRAMVAAKLAKMPQGARTDIQPSANLPEVVAPVSQPEAAALLNVSERSLRNAKTVQRDGIPELVDAVETGEIAVSAAAEIARLPKEEQAEAVEQKTVNRTSFTGNNEWFTPPEYVELARKVLGTIQVDPASHPEAQRTVKAKTFFTEADNGLAQKWCGKVWLNPPYAQPAIGDFAEKMIAEREAGRVSEAIMLTHNYTDTAWFQKLASAATAICFTRGRIKFVSPDGRVAAPTQGQAFFYFGARLQTFTAHFADVGFVVEVRQ